jgi:hypothetical protein
VDDERDAGWRLAASLAVSWSRTRGRDASHGDVDPIPACDCVTALRLPWHHHLHSQRTCALMEHVMRLHREFIHLDDQPLSKRERGGCATVCLERENVANASELLL